jgi:hypothetical protein
LCEWTSRSSSRPIVQSLKANDDLFGVRGLTTGKGYR